MCVAVLTVPRCRVTAGGRAQGRAGSIEERAPPSDKPISAPPRAAPTTSK